MDMARIFGLPAALLVIAVVAHRLSRWTRVPDIVVLLLIGVGLGPVLKWVDPGHFDATIRILGMLALILILFEGGLELRLKDAIRYSPGGILLAFVSYGFTLGLVVLIVRRLLHMSWIDGVLVGARAWLHQCGGGFPSNWTNRCTRANQNHLDTGIFVKRDHCRSYGRHTD